MATTPNDTPNEPSDPQIETPQTHSVSSSPSSRWTKLPVATYKAGTHMTAKNHRIALVILGLLLAILAGFGGAQLANSDDNPLNTSLSKQRQVVTSESQLIAQISKTVGPSVVSVNVTGTTTAADTSFFNFGGTTQQTTQSAGTGIIISSSGLILTNRHVVPTGTKSVSVTLSDGTELKDVEVLGRTGSGDSLDIAFLKIKDTKGKKLVAAKLGDSSQIQVGDAVVAIGNALGQFQNTVTAGIISGYGRSVQASDSSGSQASENLEDLFQTDAAINEGNSGGPLVNMNGQVIGINTAIAGNAQSIGFAIPISDVTGLIKSVEQTGTLQRPFLGVRYVSLTADYAYQYNLNVQHGAYIPPATAGQASIISGSPAAKAGLQEKDIITQVGGINIDQTHSLTSLLDKHAVGDKVQLTIIRAGKTLHIGVTLAVAPKS